MGGKRVAWGGQEKKLYDICCETPIDWDGVKRLIEVDADVNACEPRDDEDDDDETLLGEIAMNGFYAKQGLPTLVKLFIENGFQTQKLGHSAIRAICSSTYDRQMFDAVKLIVQNGISDAPKEYEETLDIIGWKQAGEDGVYRDYRLYDVYEAMRELVIAARDGQLNCSVYFMSIDSDTEGLLRRKNRRHCTDGEACVCAADGRKDSCIYR